jgi:intracellular protein transport protein USO1
LIQTNPKLQEKFADIEIPWSPSPHRDNATNGDAIGDRTGKINVIEALLKLTLESTSTNFLDVRLAACGCVKAFLTKHSGIRHHVLRRAIDGHVGGNDQIPNILSVVLEAETQRSADPYRKWIASVLMFHLLFEDHDAKAMVMEVTEGDSESGEEVITCVQAIVGNLIAGMQRGDDERLSIGYLMLLCGWLFEDPDVINDFLGEGSSIQSLIQVTRQSPSNALITGLCSVLLGIVYEFSSKDSPITREAIHQLLINRLGREQYIDKITKLREHPLVRDFEVLPQSSWVELDGGLPNVVFDQKFIEFLKDNFSRLIRTIDHDPSFEIPIVSNGVQKGISRELVDSLRAEVQDRNQIIQKLESDLVTIQQRFEEEQVDGRRMKESLALEISRIKQINESLQRNHDEELSKLEEHYKQSKNELLKQHGEQLRAIDSQLKETIADYERKNNKVRQLHEAEVAELRATIQTLESGFQKASEGYIQDLQTAHEDYAAGCSVLDAQIKRAEEKVKEVEGRARIAEQEVREVQDALAQTKSDVEKKEKARKEAQSELEDLLIVFGDLEAKRNKDKVGGRLPN